jgi:two-component system cell cycle response regulator DivK
MDLVDLSTWNVVAVDDEPDSLEVLIEALSMHDASVHGATSGPEALRLLETLHPTLVITDLSMPVMDGYQLLHRIRRMDGFKGTPVIALTAHAMAGDRERILAAGFDGHRSTRTRQCCQHNQSNRRNRSVRPHRPNQKNRSNQRQHNRRRRFVHPFRHRWTNRLNHQQHNRRRDPKKR